MANMLNNQSAIHILPQPDETGVLIRNLYVWERLPIELNTGFHDKQIDPNWIWVVERNGRIESCLIAAPVHCLIMLWRICSIPLAARTNVTRLLRKVLADAASRGYKGYLVCLDPDNDAERQLIRIIGRAGGTIGGKGLILAGPTDVGGL